MNTAPVTAPVVSREIAPGVTVNSGMTGAQILQAHLAANVQPHQLGIGHTDGTAMKFAQADGTIGGKASPPSPKTLEKQNAWPTPQEQAAKVGAFDAEMRAAGKQLPLATPAADAPSEIDQTYLAKLNAQYRKSIGDLEKTPPSAERDRNVAKLRGEYDAELREIYEGRRLGEKRAEFRARRDGTPAPAAPTAPGWKDHVEQGEWVGLEHLTTADTHGFTIPRFVDGQRLHVSTFELLKQAKAAGISQAQVDAVMREQAKNAGWVKA